MKYRVVIGWHYLTSLGLPVRRYYDNVVDSPTSLIAVATVAGRLALEYGDWPVQIIGVSVSEEVEA